jgi:hypothetical protein
MTKRVVSNDIDSDKLYQIRTLKKHPFDGLNTSGSITRGVTIGTIKTRF